MARDNLERADLAIPPLKYHNSQSCGKNYVRIGLLTCDLHGLARSSHHDYSRHHRGTGPVRRGVSGGDHPGSSPIGQDHAGPHDVSGQTVLFAGRPGCPRLRPKPIHGDSSASWRAAASWMRCSVCRLCSPTSREWSIRTQRRGRFILTGSHQPQLHEAISQSLAGRTAMLTLWPFSLHELRRYESARDPFDLICRGCFPRLHEEGLEPRRFYNGYLQTYVERDVRALIQLRDLSQFQKFLTLLAGRVGQIVNLASLGNDVGASGTTDQELALRAESVVCRVRTAAVLRECPKAGGQVPQDIFHGCGSRRLSAGHPHGRTGVPRSLARQSV